MPPRAGRGAADAVDLGVSQATRLPPIRRCTTSRGVPSRQGQAVTVVDIVTVIDECSRSSACLRVFDSELDRSIIVIIINDDDNNTLIVMTLLLPHLEGK